MQEYLQHSRLGGIMDGLGFRLLALALSLGWFILLWGLRLPALAAGAALYILILLIEKKTRDERVLRREKRLREQLGGELALERLNLADPGKANFETAMLLSLRKPLVLLQAVSEGIVCTRREQRLLVALLQAPASESLGPGRVLAFQRAIQAEGAEEGILCVPCPISPAAQEQALSAPPVRFLDRGALISLLGQANPATDAQLVALGKRKRARVPAKRWLRVVMDRRRAPRYALYGTLLLGLYFLTHLLYYALPGLACVLLAAACRCVRPNRNEI